MEQQLIQFITHHWPLWVAFFILLALVIINEWITQKQGPKSLSTAEVIEQMNNERAIIIDTRASEIFRAGHILGAVCLPDNDLSRFERYKAQPIILVCARGLQSASLAAKLRKQGFTQLMMLNGGMQAWLAANLPVVKGKK
jgi:rhodanese-related sulfurtransferase